MVKEDSGINRTWNQGESQTWGISPVYNKDQFDDESIPRVSTLLMLRPFNTTLHVVVTPTRDLFCCYFISIMLLLWIVM